MPTFRLTSPPAHTSRVDNPTTEMSLLNCTKLEPSQKHPADHSSILLRSQFNLDQFANPKPIQTPQSITKPSGHRWRLKDPSPFSAHLENMSGGWGAPPDSTPDSQPGRSPCPSLHTPGGDDGCIMNHEWTWMDYVSECFWFSWWCLTLSCIPRCTHHHDSYHDSCSGWAEECQRITEGTFATREKDGKGWSDRIPAPSHLKSWQRVQAVLPCQLQLLSK